MSVRISGDHDCPTFDLLCGLAFTIDRWKYVASGMCIMVDMNNAEPITLVSMK